MKTFITTIAACFLASSFLMSAPVLETGKAAPDFALKDQDGKEWTLSAQRGKYVVLEWTNHLCPFVVRHYSKGHMQSLQKELTAQGVVWLSICSSAPGKQGHVTPAQAKAQTEARKAAPSAVLLDEAGKVGKLYGARTTPHVFVIAPDGILAYQGAIDSIRNGVAPELNDKATNHVKSAIEAHKAGKPVQPSTTEPYGCSVKYAK